MRLNADAERLADVKELLATLNAAATAVAEAIETLPEHIRTRRADGHPDQFQLDVVADRAVWSVLEGSGYGMVSEESGRRAVDEDIVVVVDPIDGSVNCSRSVGPYGPSLCAVDRDGPLAAVVFNLPSSRRYEAVRGRGARLNGRTLSAPTHRERLALIATGDPCPYLERFAVNGLPAVYTRMSGASAHDLCAVADGSYDGYVDCVNTVSLWDYMGASLVLTEAGGVVMERTGTDLTDWRDPRPRRLLAAASVARLEELHAWVESRHMSATGSH